MAKKITAAPAPQLPQFVFGYQRRDGTQAIPPLFERVTNFDGPYARAYQDGAWGIIDGVGKSVLKHACDRFGPVQHGLVPVCVGNRWGLIDLAGKDVLPIAHDEIVSVGERVVSVKDGGVFSILTRSGKVVMGDLQYLGQWCQGISPAASGGLGGYITEAGTWVVKPTYQGVYDFSEGLAAFETDGKSGYLNTSGKEVIKPAFDAAYDFSEGLARVRIGRDFGYINTTGTLVIPAKFSDPTKLNAEHGLFIERSTRFRNGYARACSGGGFGGDRPEIGFIDTSGRMHKLVPDASKDGPDLFESVRLENPAWRAWQDTLESEASFKRSFDAYEKRIQAAMTKDKPAVVKTIADIVAHTFDDKVVWLKLVVYDMNDYGMTVIPMDSNDGELDHLSYEPFKQIAKASEKGCGATPKTANGHRIVNEFLHRNSLSTWAWFADLWRAQAKKYPRPVFIQGEDAGELMDLATDKVTSESNVVNMMSKRRR